MNDWYLGVTGLAAGFRSVGVDRVALRGQHGGAEGQAYSWSPATETKVRLPTGSSRRESGRW